MSTQLIKARNGIITPEMQEVAIKEQLDVRYIRDCIIEGTIVIPKNKNHNFSAAGIGKGLATKINANVGSSEKHCNLAEELEKMQIAIKYGVHSIMDLSTGGNLHNILKNILQNSSVMVGTVPIYGVATKLLKQGKNISVLNPDDLFAEIEEQSCLGVDFMTLHCGVTLNSIKYLQNDSRICGVVSRGGALLKRWMTDNQKENPLYEQFDRILDICLKYDVTISLGDGLRPGAGADGTDRAQIAELLILGELVDRARSRGVQVMVEGPGHIPFNQIATNMKIMKSLCNDAPFYVLGPLVTDAAPGYDHIVGAIGATLAAINGADFLCYLTPAEHLCLPNINDVKEGVMASRIAAHSADIVKNIKGAKERDYQISKARRNLDWDTMYKYALDAEIAKKRRDESESSNEDHCSMCGNLCAVKMDKNL